MRKIMLISVTVALLLISCDNGDMPETNPFIGTWENENYPEMGRLVFTSTNVTRYHSNGDISWNGTYTYDDDTITFNYEFREPIFTGYPNPETRSYSIENSTLRISPSAILYKITE